MFKIIKTDLSSPFLPGSMEFDETDNELLTQYCVTERWTGTLSNGLFTLGEKAAQAHGLPQRNCGLLNLIRCYEPLDRTRRVLEACGDAHDVGAVGQVGRDDLNVDAVHLGEFGGGLPQAGLVAGDQDEVGAPRG